MSISKYLRQEFWPSETLKKMIQFLIGICSPTVSQDNSGGSKVKHSCGLEIVFTSIWYGKITQKRSKLPCLLIQVQIRIETHHTWCLWQTWLLYLWPIVSRNCANAWHALETVYVMQESCDPGIVPQLMVIVDQLPVEEPSGTEVISVLAYCRDIKGH